MITRLNQRPHIAAYTIAAAAPRTQGACVIMGAPSAELTLVLLATPELSKPPVADATDPVALPEVDDEVDDELESFDDELDPVVEAAMLEVLAPAPAVMVTAVLVRNISTSDGLVKLVVIDVEKEYGEIAPSPVTVQVPALESVISQFSFWVL